MDALTDTNVIINSIEAVTEWRGLWAFLIGMVGSVAYFTVVYFGFVGSGKESRDLILGYFWGKNGRTTLAKVAWYSLVGGLIAGVFQLAERAFVPVQSFILGATWPSIVGQLLSGRQSGLPPGGPLGDKGITPDTSKLEEDKAARVAREATDLLAEPGQTPQGGQPTPGP
ncbi:MAG: hypothetical protein HYU30_06720 [Chloroflexi bacterium]|nr:hypothetical protein [Chloroflexota bacterium]MBI4198042.1 hypothetical protein [Chloroflexota bacterium]